MNLLNVNNAEIFILLYSWNERTQLLQGNLLENQRV